MSEKNLVMKAVVKTLGGQHSVGRELGVTQQTVSSWVSGKTRMPAERVLHIERLLKEVGSEIDRYDLRPDVYGPRPVCGELKFA